MDSMKQCSRCGCNSPVQPYTQSVTKKQTYPDWSDIKSNYETCDKNLYCRSASLNRNCEHYIPGKAEDSWGNGGEPESCELRFNCDYSPPRKSIWGKIDETITKLIWICPICKNEVELYRSSEKKWHKWEVD